ncbi:MAG: glycerol kinase GlpK [Planctomycetes bacterium]|nr:glycerol kinase GlpK [Planctomycetota bacterium]
MAILAIDQGTTSTRAMVFSADREVLSSASRPLAQHFPCDGWVEHDPEDIWTAVQQVVAEAARAITGPIAAIGITNQRETTVVWERATGRPIHRAIVWQDRRTAEVCSRLRDAGLEPLIQARTGLVLDAYFSATKIAWIIDHVAGARARAERGELLFGTIDCFMVWRLTAGHVHATDATNASRTLLYDIRSNQWDDDLLAQFRVPRAMLPEVRDCSADFGSTTILGAPVPITGVVGDQQAAAIGQACLEPGMAKATFGTGCFVLLNTGAVPLVSHNRLLTTVAWRISGATSYALEGSVFNAGTVVQWLRDRLRILPDAAASERIAASVGDTRGVYLVPAFTGLGAPYWDPDARGAIVGLSRDSSDGEIVRAALESVAYQCRDLLDAMAADGAVPQRLRVDGGMAANGWLMQFLSDLTALPIDRPRSTETTALGAALLAGMRVGVYPPLALQGSSWRAERSFAAAMDPTRREALYAGWKRAVGRVR